MAVVNINCNVAGPIFHTMTAALAWQCADVSVSPIETRQWSLWMARDVQTQQSCHSLPMTVWLELLRQNSSQCSSFRKATEFISSVTSSSAKVSGWNIIDPEECQLCLCAGECEKVECPSAAEQLPTPQARSLQPKADAFVQSPEDDGALMASYSVFVVEPGAVPVERSDTCQDCSWGPVWLLYLCIAFGILFVVMLVINLFLCSAMSCACSKSSKEKEASYLEDFDPYARSWQGSQYGSRWVTTTLLSSLSLTILTALCPVQVQCWPGQHTTHVPRTHLVLLLPSWSVNKLWPQVTNTTIKHFLSFSSAQNTDTNTIVGILCLEE